MHDQSAMVICDPNGEIVDSDTLRASFKLDDRSDPLDARRWEEAFDASRRWHEVASYSESPRPYGSGNISRAGKLKSKPIEK